MQVSDVISGREGLRGVQWLLRGRQSRSVVHKVLRGMLPEPGSLGECRLTRAKFRSGHKLTACFDVDVRARKAAAAGTRPVVVTWSKRDKDERRAGDVEAGLQAEAERRGTSAPFRELSAEAADWNMRVQVAPLDRRFPQLVRLSDPAYAGEMLGAPGPVPEVQWMRYRPGQRHVLRYRVSAGGAVFLKLYASEDAARAFEGTTRICEWLAKRHSGLASVRPITCLDRDGAVLFPRAHGTPLSAYLERPYQWLPWLLERAGAALRIIQSMPAAFAGAGAPRDFAAQADATARTVEHRAALLPAAANALRALLDRAKRLEPRTRCEPAVFAHGDFKADHLYVTDRELTLIDLDSRCLADPGYDGGKFLADLQWWLGNRGPACVEAAQTHFLAGYAPDKERLKRVRLWEALMLAHLGWRRLPIFRPDSAARLDSILGRADAVLQHLEAGR